MPVTSLLITSTGERFDSHETPTAVYLCSPRRYYRSCTKSDTNVASYSRGTVPIVNKNPSRDQCAATNHSLTLPREIVSSVTIQNSITAYMQAVQRAWFTLCNNAIHIFIKDIFFVFSNYSCAYFHAIIRATKKVI